MSKYAVHRCRLFDYNPRAIQCMARHKTTQKVKKWHELAVGREDGSIELMRSLSTGLYTHMVIPGSSKRTLEDLIWISGRLFSAELQGFITEYDLAKGTAKYSEDSYGGAVWCLASGFTTPVIAAGCEDGSLKLFDFEGPRLVFKRSMDRQEGRILSCAFHPSDELLVSGSVDAMRIWSRKSGHAIQRIKMQSGRRVDTIVWDVKFLKDHTVVSGDSTGKVQFWNGKNATLLKSFHSHQADILSLCVSDDETSVYASGVDPRVLEINYIVEEDNRTEVIEGPSISVAHPPLSVGTWVKGATLQRHTHDVRALAVVDKFLISGGVDTNLLLRNIRDRTDRRLKKVSAFPQKPRVHLAALSRMLLLQYPKHLDVWKLAKPEATTGSIGDEIPLQEPPAKLLQIKCSANETEDIACCSMSPCGHWVAYSTKSSFRLFRLNWKGNEPKEISIVKVRVVWFTPSFAITFTSNSSHMITSSLDGRILVVVLDPDTHVHVAHVFQDDVETDQNTAKPVHMLASYHDEFLATVDSENQIKVYDLKTYEVHCTLPGLDNAPSAISFKVDTPVLFVVYRDHQVVEYDVTTKSYTKWCRDAFSVGFNLLNFRRKKGGMKWDSWPVFGISFSKYKPDVAMLTSGSAIYFVNQSTDMTSEENEEGYVCRDQDVVKWVTKLEPLLYASFLDDGNSLLAVERSPTDIFDNLPPTLYQKKFGS